MKDINYKIVKDTNAQALLVQFPDLIPSATKSKLVVKFNHSIFIPIIAFYKEEAVALSLTAIKTDNTAELISVFVAKDYRKQGVAVQLLQLTEKILIKIKIEHVQTNYIDQLKDITAFEQLLKKTGWLAPKKVVFNMKVRNSIALENNWVSKALETSNPFEIFNWSDLNSKEICTIKNIISTKDFPTYLTPFQSEDRIDKNISKGVRVNGQLIGWCILHTINKQTRECSALYIAPGYRKSIAAHALMANAFKDMVGATIDATIFQADYRNTPLVTYLTNLFTTKNCVINKACTLTVKKIINN